MTLAEHQEQVTNGCRCVPANIPFDQFIRVNAACLMHGVRAIELFDLDAAAVRVEKVCQSPMAIHSLVKAGWTREGAGWTSPGRDSHLTQAKAYATLLWEEGSLV